MALVATKVGEPSVGSIEDAIAEIGFNNCDAQLGPPSPSGLSFASALAAPLDPGTAPVSPAVPLSMGATVALSAGAAVPGPPAEVAPVERTLSRAPPLSLAVLPLAEWSASPPDAPLAALPVS